MAASPLEFRVGAELLRLAGLEQERPKRQRTVNYCNLDIEIFQAKTHLPRNNSKQKKRGKSGRKPRHNTRKQGGRKDNAPSVTRGTPQAAGFSIRSMPFFGYKVRKKLPYYLTGSVVSGTSGLAGAYVLSANGLYDPDITGTGGQPMSFDQAMAFFNHYTVHSCRLKVTFQSDSATLRLTCGVFVSGSSTVTTSVETLLENGDGAIQILEYAGAYGGIATFSRSLNVGRFQSVANVMDDPNMRGDSASNPVEQAYFHLVVFNNSSAATGQCSFQAIMEFDATFHEPRKGGLSTASHAYQVCEIFPPSTGETKSATVNVPTITPQQLPVQLQNTGRSEGRGFWSSG